MADGRMAVWKGPEAASELSGRHTECLVLGSLGGADAAPVFFVRQADRPGRTPVCSVREETLPMVADRAIESPVQPAKSASWLTVEM